VGTTLAADDDPQLAGTRDFAAGDVHFIQAADAEWQHGHVEPCGQHPQSGAEGRSRQGKDLEQSHDAMRSGARILLLFSPRAVRALPFPNGSFRSSKRGTLTANNFATAIAGSQ